MKDRSGRTALVSASLNGHLDVVQELLNHGADVNLEEEGFGPPIVAAATQGHEGIVELLLKSGADKNALATRTEMILLRKDFDASGIEDVLAKESRFLDHELRLAVYLNGGNMPAWSSSWNSKDEFSLELGQTFSPTADSTVMELAGDFGDAGWSHILTITAGHISEDVYHVIDYGQGDLSFQKSDEGLILQVTQPELIPEHLTYKGKPFRLAIRCNTTAWPAVRFVFDPEKRQFSPDKAFCWKKQY